MSFPGRVLSALNYNETKVRQGHAEFLGASGYLQEAGAMNVYQKLQGLERRNALNSRFTTKTLHVSLNFHPSEQLSDATLLQIAAEYMQRIGFGEQPYLVYRHRDAGHPHLHVVSTTIRSDGSRIRTHNLGRQQSEKARREVEVLFGLVRAGGQQKNTEALPHPLHPLPVAYGRVETKRSLAAVVGAVFRGYAYASLPEFNAALRPFGVLADRGGEGSALYRHEGLVCRVLEEGGAKVGVPIKASDLPGCPTLSRLQQRFAAGAEKKKAHLAALLQKIDRCLAGAPAGISGLVDALKLAGVDALPYQSGEGRLYGITFVDHGTQCVFKGSDLGRAYSAGGLQARLVARSEESRSGAREVAHQSVGYGTPQRVGIPGMEARWQLPSGLAEGLAASAPPAENLPYGLLPKKKRKKKRKPST